MSSTVFGFRPKNLARLFELTKAHFKGDGFVSQSKPSNPCNMITLQEHQRIPTNAKYRKILICIECNGRMLT